LGTAGDLDRPAALSAERRRARIPHPKATPAIVAWLARMGARPAVQALNLFRPADATVRG